ncbi:hypothetical protein [Amnimonas aquatica]|uniref:hypothetical protein n=1 Tax=Amnimonas aquatica TaxID=2094561 RepID=UPI0011AFE530|nr:hypothetical protein [Amnimonas aquatica]
MSPAVPYIACRISDNLPEDVARLDAALQSGTRIPQAELAGRLITEASCDVVDGFFGNAVRELMETTGADGFREAHHVIEEIKSKLRHYLGWITGFFGNDRLAPVVQHYRRLLVMLPTPDGLRAHLVFGISPALAREAEDALQALRDPARADIRAGVEVLIRVIDEALQPLLYVPKARMKFNLVVDKTLNGVIAVTLALAYRSFRKLGTQLPPPLFPQVADHLGQFLHLRN